VGVLTGCNPEVSAMRFDSLGIHQFNNGVIMLKEYLFNHKTFIPNPDFYKKASEAFRKKWHDALISGEYKQGRDSMHPYEDSYCCLGVGYALCVTKTVPDYGLPSLYSNFAKILSHAANSLEADDKRYDPDLAIRNDGVKVSGADFNDVYCAPFEVIAKFVWPEGYGPAGFRNNRQC